MAITFNFVKKVIDAYPEKVIGKKYNYKAVKNNDTWEIWIQEFEGTPWILAMTKYKKGDKIVRAHKTWNINWDVINGANQHGSF